MCVRLSHTCSSNLSQCLSVDYAHIMDSPVEQSGENLMIKHANVMVLIYVGYWHISHSVCVFVGLNNMADNILHLISKKKTGKRS